MMNPLEELPPGTLETDAVTVRTLEPRDLDAIVRIDKEWTGRNRKNYYELKLAEAARDTGIRISLVAELDHVRGRHVAGFLLGRLYFGEFGHVERTALLDSIGVAREFSGRRVADALMRQLRMNLAALHIEKVQTQVDWDQFELLRFFAHEGFAPARRICLELAVTRPTE
jgi:GNAT superfamily N-acetyltransferase